MRFNTIRRWLARPFGHAKRQVETWLKGCTQPNSDSLLLGTVGDLTRSRSALNAENAFLRQQVIALKRQTPLYWLLRGSEYKTALSVSTFCKCCSPKMCKHDLWFKK